MIKHVEIYDGQTFCGADPLYMGVHQRDWHADPDALRAADCLRCLEAIQQLGEQTAAVKAERIAAGAVESDQVEQDLREQEERAARLRAEPGGALTVESLGDMLKRQYDKEGA